MRLALVPALALCPLLALGLAGPARSADEWPHETLCRTLVKTAVPKQDIGTAPAECDTQTLYYGSDGKGAGRDYAAARRCAYRERGTGQGIETQSAPFGGSGALMMLYANGQGVKRNIPLAKRFACEYGGAPAEVEGRLDRLDAIAKGADKRALDICDEVTSGMMMGVCAGREADFAKAGRDGRMAALQASWTPAQREAWAALRKAADEYFENVSGEETDMSGSARGMFAVEAGEKLEVALLDAVTRFEGGKRPTQKAADFARADKALNATYKQTLAKLDAARAGDGMGDYGTLSSEGVRTTQRSWLRYRDAWVRFAAARWPGTSADAWKAWLTAGRNEALKALTTQD